MFVRCKCGRLKNVNYTSKDKEVKVDCECGIKLTQKLTNAKFRASNICNEMATKERQSKK